MINLVSICIRGVQQNTHIFCYELACSLSQLLWSVKNTKTIIVAYKTPVGFWLRPLGLTKPYCHTRPILKSQPSWRFGKTQLARWATKWHYYLYNPPGHPATRCLTFKMDLFQQQLVGSSSTFKLKSRVLNQNWNNC